MSPDRRMMLALFAIAFGLRVLYAAVIGTDPEINPRPGTYDYYLAARLHDNTEWVTEPFSPNAPGYPLLLAAAFRVLGVRQWVAILINAFLGAVTALILYRIGEKRLGGGVGLLSAIWLGISVHQMHFVSIFVRDTLVTFALVVLCYALVQRFHHMRQAVWSGLAFTFLIHVDPQYVILLPFVLLYFLLVATRHRLLNLQYLFLFIATVFVAALPWTVRNTAIYGELLPVGLEASKYLRPVTALISPDPEVPDASEMEDQGVLRAHPGGVLHNSIEFWRVTRFRGTEGDPTRGLHAEPAWSARHNASNIFTFGVLLPFALVGAVVALRRRNTTATMLTMVTVVFFLMRAFLGGSERGRLPVEPLVILLAFYGLFSLLRRKDAGGRASDQAASAASA